MKLTVIKSIFAVFISFVSVTAFAQDKNDIQEVRPLYIIFDGSNSMWGELPDKSRKITAAKDVFNKLDPSLFANRKIALRIYGHRRKGDCSDTELAVPFTTAKKAITKMSDQINAVSPKGKTPISRSLIAALDDFNGEAGDILLISDGIETCDADPCELVQSWRDNNIDIRVHVVGLGLTDLSRNAMQCIADASGTNYLDANSSGELSNAIETTATSETPEPGEPNPQPQTTGPEFKINGLDEDGNYVPLLGTISREGMEPEEITSNNRYTYEGGEYFITVGVPTVNGKIYEPISKNIEIKPSGETKVTVQLKRPPMIRTKFMENDNEIRGVLTTAYQDNKDTFNLRPGEDYFILPGSYQFVADLNQDNKLETTAEIAVGDDKDIIFQAIQTVHTKFNVFAQGQDQKLRQNQQLWQNGELKYKVHFNNGAAVRPGIYTLKSEHALTGYEIENVEIPPTDQQTLEFNVSFGTAKINYVFKQEPETKDRRCWLYPIDSDGNKSNRSSKAIQCDGSEIIIKEGRYFVDVWQKLGEFDETYFDVTNGETSIVSVQQQ